MLFSESGGSQQRRPWAEEEEEKNKNKIKIKKERKKEREGANVGYTSAIGTSKGGHTILEFSFAIQEMKPNITSPFTSQIRAWFVYCTYLSCQMPSFFILKLEYLFL